MSYRLFKKYNGNEIVHLKNFLGKLTYYKNNNIKFLSDDEIVYLFMEQEDASFPIIYSNINFNNIHYVNLIIKKYDNFKNFDSKILIDKKWLLNYIKSNFIFTMDKDEFESFGY